MEVGRGNETESQVDAIRAAASLLINDCLWSDLSVNSGSGPGLELRMPDGCCGVFTRHRKGKVDRLDPANCCRSPDTSQCSDERSWTSPLCRIRLSPSIDRWKTASAR